MAEILIVKSLCGVGGVGRGGKVGSSPLLGHSHSQVWLRQLGSQPEIGFNIFPMYIS